MSSYLQKLNTIEYTNYKHAENWKIRKVMGEANSIFLKKELYEFVKSNHQWYSGKILMVISSSLFY